MAKSVGNIRLLARRARRVRARRVRHVAGRRATTASRSRTPRRRSTTPRRAVGAGARLLRAGSTREAEAPAGSTTYAERFFDALADDFNTPAGARRAVRLGRARPTGAWTRARRLGAGRLAEMLARARARDAARRRREAAPDGGSSGSRRSATRRAPRATSSAPTRSATSSPRRLGGPRHAGRAPARAARPGVIVYGRNPVREAMRGPRRVQHVYAPSARRTRCCSPRSTSRSSASRRSSGARVARPPGHLRRGGGLPLRGCGRAARRRTTRSCSRLDEVQDPHNLGAVCRVAESAGARAW